jgi:PilZ domain
MVKDKRKAVRRPIRYTAWVALDGNELHGCVLSDISESGARIDIDETKEIPDQFNLLLSNNGSAQRKCRVIWRKPRQIGVSFDRRVTEAEKTALAPKHVDEPASAPAETETVNVEPAESN